VVRVKDEGRNSFRSKDSEKRGKKEVTRGQLEKKGAKKEGIVAGSTRGAEKGSHGRMASLRSGGERDNQFQRMRGRPFHPAK